MQKYLVLLACMAIQTCLGGIYAWSVLVPALQEQYRLSAAATQIIFGTTIAMFALVMVPAGRLLPRWGPQLLAGLSGALFMCGGVAAAHSQGNFWLLWLAVSGLMGTAIGLGYVCPLVLCMEWFPRHKGLATGLGVGCFGGGAVLEAALIENLFKQGWNPLEALQAIGLAYGAIIVLAAAVLAWPAGQQEQAKGKSVPLKLLMRHRAFRAALVGISSGTFAGLLVVGNLKSLALNAGLDSATCILSVSIFAVGNALGRITWGWIFDSIGKLAIPLSLISLAIATFLLYPASGSTVQGFVTLCGLVGFGFGGCFVVYAGHIASEFGMHRLGLIYPFVFLGYGVSGIVGPGVGGWLFDLSGSHMSGILVAGTIALLGAAQTWSLLTARRTAADVGLVSARPGAVAD